ncbi:MAG: hypothetical protein DYG94_08935 [Leptolyngbya sp. PLA3]|nr:MAG: hypothetical protein EDM82_02860 [Cyanobacteria bacterium CYA]MCE7968855.1 hypothetical protein [Leptolyngbya sp. PL-A3]
MEQALNALTQAYGQLDALSQRQQALIDAGDMDRVLALLGERRALVEQVERAAPGFDVGRRAWEENADTLSEAQNAELARRVSAIERMASDIAERDRRAGEVLVRQRDNLAQEMAGLGRVSSALSAYRPRTDSPAPRFQDRKG